MALALKKEIYTYSDYLRYTEDDRFELIAGEVYDMSPAPSRRHQQISGELFRQIANHLVDRQCSVYAAPFDVRLTEADEADEECSTVVQPDISVICDHEKLDDKGCKGAPDFIAEIISPYTASKDNITKAALYEKHGVKEYWIVHPVDNILIVRHLDENGKYTPAVFYEGQGTLKLAVLPDLEIDLDALFANTAT
ncbi:Uma2 family endonuclease [Desulfococcaceae bacterium HSG9]|nr:Uma2 family endonuclease [Desulfococcaceae bacterium HSG9]